MYFFKNILVECAHEGIQKVTQQIPYENTPTKHEECVDVLVPMRAACTAFASKLIEKNHLKCYQIKGAKNERNSHCRSRLRIRLAY